MAKIRKSGDDKEMGGSEKLQAKKQNILVRDAAKSTKLTDLFHGGSLLWPLSWAGPSSRDMTGACTAVGHGWQYCVI